MLCHISISDCARSSNPGLLCGHSASRFSNGEQNIGLSVFKICHEGHEAVKHPLHHHATTTMFDYWYGVCLLLNAVLALHQMQQDP